MKKKKLILGIIIVLIMSLLGAERYTYNQLVTAIENEDTAKIEKLIDFPYLSLNRRGGEGWIFSFLSEIHAPRPLEAACETGNLKVATKLIDSGADASAMDYGQFSFVYITLQTTHDNDLEMLKLLIENGADPSGISLSENMDEHSLLQISRRLVTEDVSEEMNQFEANGYDADIALKTVEIYKYLEKETGSSEPVDELGTTSLMNAVSVKNIELVRYLLESEHDVNDTDSNGQNALFYLIDSDSVVYDNAWRKEIFDLLVEYGVDISAENEFGMTPYEYATEEGDAYMAGLLLD